MRHLKILGVALVAMFALGITATSALAALPDVSIALGGTYPLHLNFADNGKTATRLNTTAGNKIEGKGVATLLLWTELSSLGTFTANFLNVKEKTVACNTEGDATETVLTKGSAHVVFLTLTTDPENKLTLGIAFLPELVTVKCGKAVAKVEGCVVGPITDPANGTEDVTLATGTLLGDGKGKQKQTEYYENAGKLTKCILLSNFGTGNVQSEENIGEAVHYEALFEGTLQQMYTISPY